MAKYDMEDREQIRIDIKEGMTLREFKEKWKGNKDNFNYYGGRQKKPTGTG